MNRAYTFIVAVLVAGLLGTLAFFVFRASAGDQFAQCREHAAARGQASIGGPFTLVDQDGRTVTDKDVIAKPSLLYFGYTSCPDVCPIDTARNADAVDILAKKGYDVTPVMISIDPKRDTPAVMKKYISYISDKMIGLTGSAAQIRAASKAYKTYYHQIGGGKDYEMDHSTFTYLVLPKQGFVKFYRRDMKPADLANSVACFVSAS